MIKDEAVANTAIDATIQDLSVELIPVSDEIIRKQIGLDLAFGKTVLVDLHSWVFHLDYFLLKINVIFSPSRVVGCVALHIDLDLFWAHTGCFTDFDLRHSMAIGFADSIKLIQMIRHGFIEAGRMFSIKISCQYFIVSFFRVNDTLQTFIVVVI